MHILDDKPLDEITFSSFVDIDWLKSMVTQWCHIKNIEIAIQEEINYLNQVKENPNLTIDDKVRLTVKKTTLEEVLQLINHELKKEH